ncbi:MAG: hypothetical protein WC119_00550 [Synergistaceae bacterium]
MSMSKRKFYKTTIKISILSEEKIDFHNMTLADIDHEITEGGSSGEVWTSPTSEIDAVQAVKGLSKMGSDPAFFRLTEDGEDCED